MSILEPDDEMRAMIEALGLSEPDAEVNVNLLNDGELITRFSEVTEKLKELDEVLYPSTDRGRELHSTRAAYMVIMKVRGLR